MTNIAIALLEDIFQYDPDNRISALQALNSPYLALYHEPGLEPEADGLFELPGEIELPLAVWKSMMYVPGNDGRGTECETKHHLDAPRS